MKRSVVEDIGRENRVVQIGAHYLITDRSTFRLGKQELKILATEA